MLRRIVLIAVCAIAIHTHATTRYVTDREGSPVKWREWGSAAIEAAQKSNRLIFLSIGYSASWECQRMHREAFLNGENAETLNTYFVPVLLDRIEYPEVAAAYETILASMIGTTGWPANLVLTPALEPLDGAGWLSSAELGRLLVITSNRWSTERDAVQAEAHANVMRARAAADGIRAGDVDAAMSEAVVDSVAERYAKAKQLDGSTVLFLLRYAERTRHENIRNLAVQSLRNLAASPVRDQLGGGFHRCATCFEKLLVDQAMLGIAYLEAWQLTGDPDLAHVARTTFDAIIRDLRPPRSLFDSSQDAHSLIPAQGPVFENGAFYLWQTDEVVRLLGREPAGKVIRLFDMKESEQNRLSLAEERFLSETRDELAEPLAKMLELRQKRPAPFRELPMTSLNGLAISALAKAAAVFADQRYAQAAADAAQVLVTRMWDGQKKSLLRSTSGTRAIAEDYAGAVKGLLDLFEATHDPRWLEHAVALQRRQDELFWDGTTSSYTSGTTAPEIVRGIAVDTDREVPATNSIASVNLLRLAALTGNASWRERPAAVFRSHAGTLRAAGADFTSLAAAYETSLRAPSIEVVVGDIRTKEAFELVRSIFERWDPMRIVVVMPVKGALRDRIVKALPFTAALEGDPKVPVRYVCASGECRRQ